MGSAYSPRSQSKLACIAILLLATVTLSADNDNCLNAALLVGEFTDLYFDTRGATFENLTVLQGGLTRGVRARIEIVDSAPK